MCSWLLVGQDFFDNYKYCFLFNHLYLCVSNHEQSHFKIFRGEFNILWGDTLFYNEGKVSWSVRIELFVHRLVWHYHKSICMSYLSCCSLLFVYILQGFCLLSLFDNLQLINFILTVTIGVCCSFIWVPNPRLSYNLQSHQTKPSHDKVATRMGFWLLQLKTPRPDDDWSEWLIRGIIGAIRPDQKTTIATEASDWSEGSSRRFKLTRWQRFTGDWPDGSLEGSGQKGPLGTTKETARRVLVILARLSRKWCKII